MNDVGQLNSAPLPIKLRVEDYLALDAAGAFERYAKAELLEGELFYLNAQHRPHAYIKGEFLYRLRRALEEIGSDVFALAEVSIAIPANSVPEPDIVLTTEPYGEGFVPLDSVRLIVEIADATVRNDLTRKAAIYAEAGVAEYWVADIPARLTHRFSAPGIDGYAQKQQVPFGEQVEAASLPLTIKTPELLR